MLRGRVDLVLYLYYSSLLIELPSNLGRGHLFVQGCSHDQPIQTATSVGSKRKYAMTNQKVWFLHYDPILCKNGDLSVDSLFLPVPSTAFVVGSTY